jgi:hypothetical protein
LVKWRATAKTRHKHLILASGALSSIAPEVRSLDILWMVVSPRPSHASRIDVIGYDVAVIREGHLTDGTLPFLFYDFAVEQLPHLGFRAEFAIPSGVMRVFDPLHPKTSDSASLLDRLATTAIEGSVDGAEFLATEFMNSLLRLTYVGKGVRLWVFSFKCGEELSVEPSSHAAHGRSRL